MSKIIPLSAIIATRNRGERLRRTLDSILNQSKLPAEILICDASDNFLDLFSEDKDFAKGVSLKHWQANSRGAAPQRNEAYIRSSQPFILFVDDDVDFYKDCLQLLWEAIKSDASTGGCNATIVSCTFRSPSLPMRLLYQWAAGKTLKEYGGRCFGPAINVIHDNRDDLPALNPVDWLNTTCVLYRKEALPNPPFPTEFKGASVAEDLALSQIVRKNWKLIHVRKAEIFHDSQPGDHKANHRRYKAMEVANRFYIATVILGNDPRETKRKLLGYEYAKAIFLLKSKTGRNLFQGTMQGILDAKRQISKYECSS